LRPPPQQQQQQQQQQLTDMSGNQGLADDSETRDGVFATELLAWSRSLEGHGMPLAEWRIAAGLDRRPDS